MQLHLEVKWNAPTGKLVYDLPVSHYSLQPLSSSDAERFIGAFSRFYRASVDTAELVGESNERQLEAFLSHPPMLNLVCILKAGPLPAIPGTSLVLIKRAIDTVRWDLARGLARASSIPVERDSSARVGLRRM
jgi:hypothetical protein